MLAFGAANRSALGWITEEEATSLIESVLGIATVLGFSLAVANNPKPVPVAQRDG